MDFRDRLSPLRVGAADLTGGYRPATVARFVGPTLTSLVLGLPFALLGLVVVAVPFLGLRLAVRALKPEQDIEATYKLLGGLVLFPLWSLGIAVLAWWKGGPGGGLGVLVSLPLLALWTRHELESWRSRVRDVRLFLQLGNRSALRKSLLAEGESLASDVEREAQTYLAAAGASGPSRVMTAHVPHTRLELIRLDRIPVPSSGEFLDGESEVREVRNGEPSTFELRSERTINGENERAPTT